MAILQPGSFGDHVRNWQLFLTKHGFYSDPIDAFFGASTKVATAGFQRAHNLPTDGVVKDKTLEIAVKLGFSLSGMPPRNLNKPPISNAGADQTITLTGNNHVIVLDGSGSVDPDGVLVAFNWKLVSGPSSIVITNPNSQKTTVTIFNPGTYIFELTVTDDRGTSAKDTVQVKAIVAENKSPIANAGPDQTITLTGNNQVIVLDGSGSLDPDGVLVAFRWTLVSGPTIPIIANPNSPQTTVTNLVGGTYIFELTVTDDRGTSAKDTVQVKAIVAENKAPIANAGADQTITLTGNNHVIVLDGSGSTDPDGILVGFNWRLVSGPTALVIVNPNSSQTSVNILNPGTYIFELTVTDNRGTSAKDTVQVKAIVAENKSPIANAGADQTITLTGNNNAIVLDGSGSVDPDGVLVAFNWRLLSGPNSPSLINPNSPQTTVTNLVAGTYLFELTVTDDRGVSAKDTVLVIVFEGVNKAPIANAGRDQHLSISAATNGIILNGDQSSDPDGGQLVFGWQPLSGPQIPLIISPNSPQTIVTGMVSGLYIFELSVTDNRGASAKDTVQITISPAQNQPPIANAGIDQVIKLSPVNTTIKLDGSNSKDPDGSIIRFGWGLISGQGRIMIKSPNSAQTNVSGFREGVYRFELTVTDSGGALSKDTIQVTVTK
ncbi:MAG: PKD domain-containing protein [Algoriphagus sp.]|nr:PKD domain-containing protein [Algoriphagus sp.]